MILRTRKIKIFNIFYHLIIKLQCQQLIMSVVFTPKFQLRICLRSSKVTFLQRSAPGDFSELSLSFFRLSKVNQDPNHSYKYWFLNIKNDKNVTTYDQNLDFSIFEYHSAIRQSLTISGSSHELKNVYLNVFHGRFI